MAPPKTRKTSKPKSARGNSASSNRTNQRGTAKKSRARNSKTIHVITDGTGGLPRHFMTAIMSQFPQITGTPSYHVFCDSPGKIKRIFQKSIKTDSLVFHAVADGTQKALIQQSADAKQLPHFDLTGDAVVFLAEQTGCQPTNDVDCVHNTIDDAYLDRIDAWEFTMQHDDSRRLESIDQADIVLVGLSRVSKTPTSAYLGWLGHRVANVSLIPAIGLPKEIKKCKGRVIALTMQPKRLSEIRSRRMQVNGFDEVVNNNPHLEFHYAGIRDTIREVMDAEAIYKRMRFPMIDVTESSVEETAARVLELAGRNKK